jgi:hypothetical protein
MVLAVKGQRGPVGLYQRQKLFLSFRHCLALSRATSTLYCFTSCFGLRSLQAAAAGGLAAGVLLLPLQRLLLSRDTDNLSCRLEDGKAAGMCAGPGARSAVWLLSAVIDMVGPGHM